MQAIHFMAKSISLPYKPSVPAEQNTWANKPPHSIATVQVIMKGIAISGAGVLLQNSRLVHYQAQGNHLSHKSLEAKQKQPQEASRAHSANGTAPSPISRHRKAAVEEA